MLPSGGEGWAGKTVPYDARSACGKPIPHHNLAYVDAHTSPSRSRIVREALGLKVCNILSTPRSRTRSRRSPQSTSTFRSQTTKPKSSMNVMVSRKQGYSRTTTRKLRHTMLGYYGGTSRRKLPRLNDGYEYGSSTIVRYTSIRVYAQTTKRANLPRRQYSPCQRYFYNACTNTAETQVAHNV